MKDTFDYRRICFIHYSCVSFEHIKANNILICCFRFFIRMIGYLLMSPVGYKSVSEVLVVIPTANNQRSINPILEAMKHKNYFCVERFFNFLPYGMIYLRSILHSHVFWELYKSSTKEEKHLIRSHFADFAPAIEVYKAIGAFFDQNPQIRLLIVSNDHMPIMLSFIEQARFHGVKTLYSQHASVSGFFPPLKFDFSFLDGQESFEKYKAIQEIDGKVFLIGSPRFDEITRFEKKDSDAIGIAFNWLDNMDKAIKLIQNLRNNGFNNIIVRPHPQLDKRNHDWGIFTQDGCEISHPLSENPFHFISRLSFLIAGASSIHLEAALLRVPSVIFSIQTKEEDIDYYGYAKRHLTPIAKTIDEIMASIHRPYIPSIDILRYYDAAFETSYNGKSSILVAAFIDAFLDGKDSRFLSKTFNDSGNGYYVIK